MNRPVQFDCDCNGLVQAVKDAADPTLSQWIPYNGDRIATAVLFAKLVMRKARRIGLYDDSAEKADRLALGAHQERATAVGEW